MSKKRLYISADIEGIAGVVSMEQLLPKGFEYQQAREWMTAEVSAACDAAFALGIDEVVVSDSHGNGQNLLIDELPDNVQVVRSWPRPLCMMEGIQEGQYIGALLIGYHTGAGNPSGVIAHTLSGGISELRLNGQLASETVISAATAAHFDVPIIMASGDDAYIDHVNDVLGDIETLVTKYAISYTSARMIKPRSVQLSITDSVTRALSTMDRFTAKRLQGPIEVDVLCTNQKAAELLSYLPTIERVDGYTIRFVGKDMVEVSRFLQFLISCGCLSLKI